MEGSAELDVLSLKEQDGREGGSILHSSALRRGLQRAKPCQQSGEVNTRMCEQRPP